MIIFDIETNGLIDDLTKIHCLEMYNTETKEFISCADQPGYMPIDDGLKFLEGHISGHNILGFDNQAINKVKPNIKLGKSLDTLLLSRLIYTDLATSDLGINIPSKLIGKHSLEAWGHRLKLHKGDYQGGWENWSEEMQEYCKQDVKVTVALYEKLIEHKYSQQAIDLEHEFAEIMIQQEKNGVPFNSEKAEELYTSLHGELQQVTSEINTVVPDWVEEEIFIPKRNNKTLGYVEGIPFIKQKVTKFNPGSRQQILKYLDMKYDWVPDKLTKKGNPALDHEVMSTLTFPEAKQFSKYLEIKALMGKIKDAKGAWLNYVTPENKIHGYVNTNGAVTGRCTHCVPLTTRCLTRRGWKHYNELTLGEEVLGIDINTKKKQWTKLKNVNVFKNKPIGSIGNQSVRLRCTEEHKWVVRKRSRFINGDRYVLLPASDIKSHDAIVMNAPYLNDNMEVPYKLPPNKHEYNHLQHITHFSDNQLSALMSGFLLADGYLQKSANGDTSSWTFSQSEGNLLEAFQTGFFLQGKTRISRTCKTKLKGENQRFGYTVRQTQTPWFRSNKGMLWKYENHEDVWCPETELGTWTMLQDDGVMCLTGNSHPNLAQVPSSRKFKGKECRELFHAPDNKVMVGCDASGLELRMLGHFLTPYDEGRYAKIVCEGDVHTENQHAAALDNRDLAKKFIYTFLYGAGDEKIGATVAPDSSANERRRVGARLKQQFLKGTPGLEELIIDVKRASRKGYLIGLDGRLLKIRSEHAALNTLLQSAGGLVMKKATCLMWQDFLSLNLEVEQALSVHDEVQVFTSSYHSNLVGAKMKESIKKAGEYFNLNCPLDGEYHIGFNWSETH